MKPYCRTKAGLLILLIFGGMLIWFKATSSQVAKTPDMQIRGTVCSAGHDSIVVNSAAEHEKVQCFITSDTTYTDSGGKKLLATGIECGKIATINYRLADDWRLVATTVVVGGIR
jgi:hypothetical protein